MDANENPFGSSIKENLNRYPDPYQKMLKTEISRLKDIPADQIFLGNGSDEPIDLIIRLFCNPEIDKIIISPPTYGMYEVAAEINQTGVIRVPLTREFQLQPDEILKYCSRTTKLLFICSPNNPTGNSFDRDQIIRLVSEFTGIVVLDEAYIDFCPEKSLLKMQQDHENLIILQTFSKAWGLAGLRLGMAFASPDIIQYLNKIKTPYNISELTQRLALEAVGNVVRKEKFVNDIRKEIAFLRKKLSKIPLVEKIYDSDTNFLLVKFQNASRVFHFLTDKKIIVRDRSHLELCENTLRITAGTRSENEMLLNVLNKYTQAK